MDSQESSPRAPVSITSDETRQLHETACRLVEAAARGQTVAEAEQLPGDLARCPVVGVFVTLRKQKKLRGCIGNFSSAILLGDALRRAAAGVVSHDSRFPVVTPDELPELMLTVSILHTRELLDGDAAQRAASIRIGVHGLDIQFRGHAGLLLPSVARDYGFDEVSFLQAVCQKAGLAANAWQEPEATIYRFSAIVFEGPWVQCHR